MTARNALVPALLGAIAALLVSASPAAAVKVRRSQEAVGVSVNGLVDPKGRTRPIARDHLDLIGASGIRRGRTDAHWVWAEPAAPAGGRHSYDWRELDNIATLLARDGVRWLPVIAYSTPWAATVPGTDKAPPASDADFAAYAEAFARRYGAGGSFWARHPELPQLPVTAYEIWNEPNLHVFWHPTPDPARYASLYLAARSAIKRAQPDAKVIVGGLAPYADGYVEDMYAARPELERSVDAVAYHPYGADAELVLRLVRKMRATLDGLGSDRAPIWVTEVGWPTQGTGGLSADALPDSTRAANLSLVTDSLLGSNCRVETVSPYTWATPERDPEHDEQWLGLVHPDTTFTAAADAYVAAVERNAAAAGDDPRLALELCRDRGTKFAKPLRLGIDVDRTAGDCRRARVTYRGRPLNGVPVAFGKRRVDTGTDGTAASCAGGDVSARVLDVARSGTR
jgi:polysaccharide biosynthesis protein PslG